MLLLKIGLIQIIKKDEDNGSDFAPWKASQSPEPPADQV